MKPLFVGVKRGVKRLFALAMAMTIERTRENEGHAEVPNATYCNVNFGTLLCITAWPSEVSTSESAEEEGSGSWCGKCIWVCFKVARSKQ